MRLTPQQKEDAVAISRALFASRDLIDEQSVSETAKAVVMAINEVPALETEYFEIVDGDTMQPVSSWDESEYIVGCITVYCGEVRLIDNIIYKNKQ